MRRADRLFQIIQILRRRRIATARHLAAELEVSERTVYRDIQDLMARRVPIEGEAGVGYRLREGFDLPPLMFTAGEVDALVLGARIVQTWTDEELARHAADALAKIEAVLPEALRRLVEDSPLLAPPDNFQEPTRVDLTAVREAVHARRKIHIHYRDNKGDETRRTVRPLGLWFYGPVWLLAAWCELRTDFRFFRLDRVLDAAVLAETFAPEPGRTLQDLIARHGRDGFVRYHRDRAAAERGATHS